MRDDFQFASATFSLASGKQPACHASVAKLIEHQKSCAHSTRISRQLTIRTFSRAVNVPLNYPFVVTPDIKQRLETRPFQPFTIHVADGREYRVPTADHAHVYPSGGRVSVFTDDDREFILPALLISGLALDSQSAQ